tara:strand:- start:312 stop:518 length:207 start_codon:yes stop_codon:yes gene_type:complete
MTQIGSILLIAAGVAFAIWTLIDLYKRKMQTSYKIAWAIGIVFLAPVFSLIYFIVIMHPIFQNHDRRG